MKKSFNTIFARDALISLANKLPENLVLDSMNAEGSFTINFLLQLAEEQLCDLRKEARKQKNENFFLFFYSVTEGKEPKSLPTEVKNFSTFDFSKVKSISFNGNTSPYLPYRNWSPIHYVSVTFTLKG